MIVYHCNNSNLCLVKDEARKIYTLTVYDKERGRSIVWNQDKHRALTEFMDKIFK